MPEFKEPFYFVHPGGRDPATRSRRGRSAGHRFVQKLAGGTVNVRYRRPATVTAEQLALHLPELIRAEALGHIEVRTPAGALVDLQSGVASKVDVVEEPLPSFRPDSAANDLTFPEGVGQPIPQFEGGLAETEEGVSPELLSQETANSEDDEAPVDSQGDPAVTRQKQKTEKKSKK